MRLIPTCLSLLTLMLIWLRNLIMSNIGPRGIEWLSSINIARTKEIVLKRLKRLNPRLYITPQPITEVQQVSYDELLGVTLCHTLRFDVHIGNVLKMCSQRYLLKLLRDQGLPRRHLNTCWSEIADFEPIFARSASAVTPSKKSLINTPLRAFQ